MEQVVRHFVRAALLAEVIVGGTIIASWAYGQIAIKIDEIRKENP